MPTFKEIEIANKTYRAWQRDSICLDTVKHLTTRIYPLPVSILDYGAGKGCIQTNKLRAWRDDKLHFGPIRVRIFAYDFGKNKNNLLHIDLEDYDPYDVIFASNVLNVQSSLTMLRSTLEEIKSFSGGWFVFNYPQSPRKLNLTTKEMLAIVSEYFELSTPLRKDVWVGVEKC